MGGAGRTDAGRVGTVWLTLVALGLAVAGGATALVMTGTLPGDPGDPKPSATATTSAPTPAPEPYAPVLEPVDPPATAPVGLDPRLVADPRLGPDPGARVVDVATGAVLLDRGGSGARTPASVAKLLTAAAALSTLPADRRLETRTVEGGARGEVVLVGGGDATLASGRSAGRSASLVDLADATAAVLRLDGIASVTVRIDDSLFAGPAVAPAWEPGYVGAGEVSPVSALSVDAGAVRPGARARSADPALAAGRRLAALLGARGFRVTADVSRAEAPAGSRTLAAVRSPDVPSLVEQMLLTSDDDLAEALLRLVALEAGLPPTFDGGTTAVVDAVAALGAPTDGLRLLDGSGLARGSRLAPETLTALLALAADGSQPRLAPLVSGLPVAGFSGTLADRFGSGRRNPAAGIVRAKTGTLTGVASLAGLATVGEGPTARVVAFALLSDDVPATGTLAAREALDRIAAALLHPDG